MARSVRDDTRRLLAFNHEALPAGLGLAPLDARVVL
jgi:hypothetical protein